jgi:hypothetical protein
MNNKLWTAIAMMAAMACGYALPRPTRPNWGLLDAVAAVQRRKPHFLITEPVPTMQWAQSGSVYVCRTPKTPEQIERLGKYPLRHEAGWEGIVCFRGTRDLDRTYVPWINEGGERCLDCGAFAVFGDAGMLREIRDILAAEGCPLPSSR